MGLLVGLIDGRNSGGVCDLVQRDNDRNPFSKHGVGVGGDCGRGKGVQRRGQMPVWDGGRL